MGLLIIVIILATMFLLSKDKELRISLYIFALLVMCMYIVYK